MFSDSITRITKVVKFLSKKAMEYQDNNWISAQIDNVSYELTIAIQDLKRLNKVVREKEIKDTIGFTPMLKKGKDNE